MSNLIVVTLPTMHFRRAPETRNLFATRRLYIYIYYHCQFYRFVSSRERFHRGKSCYRCYTPPSPYPKVNSLSHKGHPSLSLYIYIFIDSCRGKIRVFPFLRHRRTNLENTNLDLVLFRFEATDFSKCSSHRFERWKKGTRRKERRRRKSEVLTGGAKQFDSHPGRREFGDAKLRGNCEKRSCKEKLRRIKKRRSWFPSPPPRGGRISSPPQRSTAVYFSAK